MAIMGNSKIIILDEPTSSILILNFFEINKLFNINKIILGLDFISRRTI